jgi:hypothetical protein
MSLFPTLQQIAPRATLLYDCFPGLLTRQTPSQFGYGSIVPPISAYYDTATPPGPCPAGNAVVCWQRFTGTDPITNFPYPSFSPLFAYAGGAIEGSGMYVIDHYYGFGNPGSQAGYDASIGVTSENTTVRGVTISTLKANQYNHVPEGYDSGIQSHFLLYRQITAPGFVDLDKACIDTWIELVDHKTVLGTSNSNKFRTIHDYKTSTDFRIGVQIVRADATDAAAFGCSVGDLGIMVALDNQANVLTPHEFCRMKSYNVTIPLEAFKSTLYFERATTYSDLDTGRVIYLINDEVVIDINPVSVAQYNIDHPAACTGNSPATNCENRHKGINNAPWQRLFLVSNYFGGLAGKDVQFKLSRLRIWDDAYFTLPSM